MTRSTFTLFPAIDLKAGQVVRLRQGEMNSATAFATDPATQAAAFAASGCKMIHVVDLDGAFAGAARNASSIAAILAAARAGGAAVQLGGGIRDMAAIAHWLDAGIARVILGSVAVQNPDLVAQAAAAYPGRIVVGIDAKDGRVAINGWAETSDIAATDLAERISAHPIAAIIFTDVARDGMGQGINLTATAALAEAARVPVIASGGIGGLNDVLAVAATAATLRRGQIAGVIVGRALYDGKIDLAQAQLALAA